MSAAKQARADQRGQPPDPEWIQAPQQRERGSTKRGGDQDLDAEPRKDWHQEGKRIVSTTMRSTKFTVVSSNVVLELR